MIKIISGSQFPKEVIPLIEKAKKNIRVVVFDWRWYPSDVGSSVQLFNQAIVRAARRGVAVSGIVNNDQIVKIFRDNACNFKKIIVPKLVHCKLMIIDEEIAITGSHNYTASAFQMNLELSVIIDDVQAVADMGRFYDNIWLK
jgi:phosphatidylserine/phosphatidylglycerophosphate/cardiolipin synthase-like enzyme